MPFTEIYFPYSRYSWDRDPISRVIELILAHRPRVLRFNIVLPVFSCSPCTRRGEPFGRLCSMMVLTRSSNRSSSITEPQTAPVRVSGATHSQVANHTCSLGGFFENEWFGLLHTVGDDILRKLVTKILKRVMRSKTHHRSTSSITDNQTVSFLI
jgi:hypothetical protein